MNVILNCINSRNLKKHSKKNWKKGVFKCIDRHRGHYFPTPYQIMVRDLEKRIVKVI